MKSKKMTIKKRPNNEASVITLGDYLGNPPPPPEYILGDWLTTHSCTMIHSPSGVGKSWFSMAIGLAVAGGGKIVKWDSPKPMKVLYVDGEMSANSCSKRLSLLRSKMQFKEKSLLNDNFMLIPSGNNKFVDSAGAINHYLSLIDEFDLNLLIIDNIRTLTSLMDENAASSWKPINDFLIQIRKVCAVIIVHHDGKSKGYSGSSNAITVLDNVIGLSPLSKREYLGPHLTEASLRFEYIFNKARDLPDDTSGDVIGFDDEKGWISNTTRATDIRIELMNTATFAASGEFETQKDLAKHLGINPETLRKRKIKYKKDFGEEMVFVRKKRVPTKLRKNGDTQSLVQTFCLIV